MKLIFIYGSPAVGKLTVAKELSKKIGYPIFHNHLTVDLAKVLFDFEDKRFSSYRDKLRYEVIEMAAKYGINMIATFVYAPNPYDDTYVRKVMKIVKRYNGKTYFVHLYAHPKELHKRVKEESRKLYHKVKSVKKLKHMLNLYDNFPKISFVESLEIDNTNLSPKKTALMIVDHYKLKGLK